MPSLTLAVIRFAVTLLLIPTLLVAVSELASSSPTPEPEPELDSYPTTASARRFAGHPSRLLCRLRFSPPDPDSPPSDPTYLPWRPRLVSRAFVRSHPTYRYRRQSVHNPAGVARFTGCLIDRHWEYDHLSLRHALAVSWCEAHLDPRADSPSHRYVGAWQEDPGFGTHRQRHNGYVSTRRALRTAAGEGWGRWPVCRHRTHVPDRFLRLARRAA